MGGKINSDGDDDDGSDKDDDKDDEDEDQNIMKDRDTKRFLQPPWPSEKRKNEKRRRRYFVILFLQCVNDDGFSWREARE